MTKLSFGVVAGNSHALLAEAFTQPSGELGCGRDAIQVKFNPPGKAQRCKCPDPDAGINARGSRRASRGRGGSARLRGSTRVEPVNSQHLST